MGDPRILLVDDDPVILRLLKVNFEMEGYAVLSAANGAEAVDVATSERPDIILLDVMMPGMNGLEAAEKLRSQAATVSIPIVFVSAKAQTPDVRAGLDAGAVDYLTKPFDPVELVQKVEDLLAKSRG